MAVLLPCSSIMPGRGRSRRWCTKMASALERAEEGPPLPSTGSSGAGGEEEANAAVDDDMAATATAMGKGEPLLPCSPAAFSSCPSPSPCSIASSGRQTNPGTDTVVYAYGSRVLGIKKRGSEYTWDRGAEPARDRDKRIRGEITHPHLLPTRTFPRGQQPAHDAARCAGRGTSSLLHRPPLLEGVGDGVVMRVRAHVS